MFEKQTLLITGGTGSFGNAALNRFLDTDIAEIRIFSRDEKKQDDMRKFYNNSKIKFYIGDVRARQSLDAVMTGVDYVFHAAALKQVPSCEFFPIEAVRTNVLGAENVLDSAIQHGVKKAVILSTDKAVYPLNAMGMSKAMMEKVMIARSRNIQNGGSLVCGTRYGNVMASRGSVIPLFVHQIHEGKPLTLTDPTMTRFMMSLENAVELVVFAFENANQGDIFVQKAPACTIETLAKALLELYHANNEIKVIGIRHGEKVYETLVAKEDMLKAEDLGDYYRIPADTRDLNYDLYFVSGKFKIREAQEYTSHNTKQLNVEETKKLLLQLQFIRDDLGLQ
jgi:UDP-glucose 4-epimerase